MGGTDKRSLSVEQIALFFVFSYFRAFVIIIRIFFLSFYEFQ